MNVITVTRQYGAGGYEAAHRLAEQLGWELLDRELLHRAAAVESLPDAELERLDEKAVSLTDRFRLHPAHQRYIHGLREAARQAAADGNVVLVGRGTGLLLADLPGVFHLCLVADTAWRARRMAQREEWSYEKALTRCTEEDRVRARFAQHFFGPEVLRPEHYHVVFDTGRVALDDVVACVVALIRHEEPARPAPGRRVLTLARQLGAGDTGFAPTLAERLGMRVYDRALLEQEAIRLGVAEAELEKIDEQAAGIFERLRPGSLHHDYFRTLGKLMAELAGRSDVLLVGRSGNCFLRDDQRAFHLRLVAPMSVRVWRVMEHRWVREEPAKKLIAQSDAQRRRFCADYFGVDWSDPLQYHLTLNSGQLGPTAIDLAAFAAERFWARASERAST